MRRWDRRLRCAGAQLSAAGARWNAGYAHGRKAVGAQRPSPPAAARLPPAGAALPLDPTAAPLPAAAALPPLAAELPAVSPPDGTRVPSHPVFAPGKMSLHPMPNAVESMPQMLSAVQQLLPSEIITAGHLGASGAGGVQVPDTMKPHLPATASRQHAIGVTGLTAGSAIGAVQLALPHSTTSAAPPDAPLPPLAAGPPALLVPVSALPVAERLPPAAGGIMLGAFICAASLPPRQALASVPTNNQPHTEFRAFICNDTRFPRALPQRSHA
jgi:hypothetical protein